MASLQRHSDGTYRLRFWFSGKQWFRSLDTDDETEAEGLKAIVERTIGLVNEGALSLPDGADRERTWLYLRSGGKIAAQPAVAESKTLEQVATAYLDAIPEGSKEPGSLATEKIHIEHIKKVLGKSLSITSVDRSTLQAYANKRAKKVTATTIKKELQTMRQVYDFARTEGMVTAEFPRNGIRLPKSPAKPPFRTWADIAKEVNRGKLSDADKRALWDCVFLNEKQVVDLLAHVEKEALHPFITPMFAFAAYTGARRSEITRSELSDFRLDDGIVLIREKKRRRAVQISYRQVQVNARLKTIMRKWLKAHPGGKYTICREDGTPLTRDMATHHFKTTLDGSKWSVVRGFHVLRHSFASICASKGIPEHTIDAWMGHTTEEMRERYRHLFPDQQAAAMDMLFTAADLFKSGKKSRR